MGMRTDAVLVPETGAPARMETIELTEPGRGEVLVRVEAASLCHSDLSVANGTLRQAMPIVLGHEASGVVVRTGEDVHGLTEGDRVLLLWNAPCGECWFCDGGEPYLCENTAQRWARSHATVDMRDGCGTQEIHPCLSIGGFAGHTVVEQVSCWKLPADMPTDLSALLGCAVTTGVGAVTTTARVRSGQSVVVLGLGGVGLAAVQGARIAGADPIIAIDRGAEKLPLAASMGATHVEQADDDTRRRIRDVTGGRGADHVLDCVGLGDTIKESWKLARRGGTVTLVGIGGKADTVEFSSLELYHFARTLVPCVNGSLDPQRDLPGYVDHVRSGALDLAALVSSEVDLAGIPAALEQLAAGNVARVLVRPHG